jgi:hypothetical protein
VYTVRVVYCPENEHFGRPEYQLGARFRGADFAFSLHGGVWPTYMIVEIEGIIKNVPGSHGTQWTIGPLGSKRRPRQGLFEYDGGQRILATATGSARTLKDVTEQWEQERED